MIGRRSEAGVVAIDLTPAENFGKLEYLLTPSAMMAPAYALRMLRQKLRKYTDCDYILLGGDLAAVSAAVAIAAANNGGHVHVLKWDSLYKEYTPIHINTNLKE
jgi:ABC-type sugar transport system substrate-binding protein